MAVEIQECTMCAIPEKQVFSGQAVVEEEFSLVPGIPRPEKVTIEPLINTFKIELACCDLVVVCGIIRKTVIFPSCYCLKPIIHDFTFQADIPVNINSKFPISPCDLKVTGVDVCDGCFKLLCPTCVGHTTVFHKIQEKDILTIEVTFKMPDKCFDEEYEEEE